MMLLFCCQTAEKSFTMWRPNEMKERWAENTKREVAGKGEKKGRRIVR